MKRILQFSLLLLCLLIQGLIFAQAPQKINYQAVARDASGVPLLSQPVNITFDIRQNTITGTIVYSENHATSTNQFGLFTAEIGGGTPVSGTFPGINWSTGLYYLQVTVNGDVMPATQLLSVPYALHAQTATSGSPGPNGHNALADSVAEPAGPNCPNGGYLINMGSDDNDDGILQALEIDISYYICNGLNGSATSNDTSATNELQTLSISNDTIFLSNGGSVVLPSASGDNDWSVVGSDMSSIPTGNVGIGTTTPISKLSVTSSDSLIASFIGLNSDVAAITVAGISPSAKVGSIFLTGSDSGIVAVDPSSKQFFMANTTPDGHVVLAADSSVSAYGKQIAFAASGLIYNQTPRIYNSTDSIFNFSSSGTIINVNQGMFLTDSLYVLGNNAANANWVLANDGLGQAVWTNPASLGSSLWQSNTPDIYFNTGNVGIGTTTPASELHVNGQITVSDGTFAAPSYLFDGTSTGFYRGAGDRIEFVNNGFTSLQIYQNQLRVKRGSLANPGVVWSDETTTGIFGSGADDIAFVNNGSESMRIDGTGNVGIGTTNPLELLHINNGSIRIDDGSNPYTLPAADGTINEVLTTDGSGNVSWQPISGNPSWELLGNSGTVDGTNFIGTTDNVPLNFRVNNIQAGRIDHILFNAALGRSTLQANTTGQHNTAIGNNAMINNSTGMHNTAIGSQALQNGNSNDNVAVGWRALMGSSGGNNTAVGYQAGNFVTAGSNNTFIGYDADATVNSLTNATAIGANAAVSQSNSLILGNNANVGIGTSSPNHSLDIASNSFNVLQLSTISANTNVNIDINSTGSGAAQFSLYGGTGGYKFLTNGFGIIPVVHMANNGNVGIGIENPLVKLHIAQEGQTTAALHASHNLAADQSGNLTFLRSRGTIAIPTAVQSGDRLGKVEWVGWNGGTSNFEEKASIRVIADENYVGGSTASHMEFHVTPFGQSTSIEAMNIANNGFVGLGTGAPSSLLHLMGGTITIDNGANPYTFPIADGTANQVLTTDGLGNATWQNPAGGSLWLSNSPDIYFNTGKVGVGTNTPQGRMDIFGDNTFNNNLLRIQNTSTTNGFSIAEIITNGAGPGINVSQTGNGTAAEFEISNSSSVTSAVQIMSNGTGSKSLEVIHTGSSAGSTDIGVYSEITGAGTTNIAGYFNATGATNNYALQIVDGSEGAGKVLTSDASGNATWQAPPTPINWGVNTSTTSIPAGTMTPLLFNNIEYNNGAAFNGGTGQFVAPVTGIYHIDATVTFDASALQHEIQIQILRNGGTYKTVTIYNDPANNFTTAHISGDVYLPVANTVSIGIYQNSAGTISPTLTTPTSKIYFNGHLIR